MPTNEKLKKLEKIEESNRARVRKFLEKAEKKGKKQISAIISFEAYDEICRRRDRSVQNGVQTTIGKILEDALLNQKREITNGR